ncbi:MAG: serine/threonine-protein kinase [Candidatus Micrarchaeota archaeon]
MHGSKKKGHGPDGGGPTLGTVLPEAEGILKGSINGKYDIIGKIGGGGTADIYLAVSRESGERVAVKVLKSDPHIRSSMDERMFIEAKAAAMINHPNVIEVLDVGTFGDMIYCAMEYVEGEDLGKTILRERCIAWERAARIIMDVCDGAEAAHRMNILHRDLKPENIVLYRKGGEERVKVLDFGLAKMVGGDQSLTKEGIIVGTPTYMAPEQAWKGSYDHRVDIYAIGAILYEMLCGRPPFISEAPDEKTQILQKLMAHLKEQPKRPGEYASDAGAPRALEDVVMKALAKEPGERFQSAAEMKNAIAACLPRPVREEPDDAPVVEITGGDEGEAPVAPQPRPSAAPKRASEVVLPRADKGPASKDIEEILGEPPVEAEPHGCGWCTFRRLLAVGLVGAAAYLAYQNWGPIRDFAKDAYHRISGSGPAPEREAHEEMQHPDQTSFMATIESDPPGASAYELAGGTRRHLGFTPLSIRFQNGEHVILVSKRGHQDRRVTLSEAHPAERLSLRRIPRRPRVQPQPVEELDEEPPADEAEPPSGGQGEAPE